MTMPVTDPGAHSPPSREPLTLLLERVPTPLGEMLVVTDDCGRLRALDWKDHEADMHILMRRQYRDRIIDLRETGQESTATTAMLAYFSGELDAIDAIEVVTGGTDFQRTVWAALRTIPAGTAISYLELASRIGRPSAVRAVGMANGSNPVSVVVPCHRVIGSNATLVGYGGGLQRKRWLLEHEGAIPAEASVPETARLPGF